MFKLFKKFIDYYFIPKKELYNRYLRLKWHADIKKQLDEEDVAEYEELSRYFGAREKMGIITMLGIYAIFIIVLIIVPESLRQVLIDVVVIAAMVGVVGFLIWLFVILAKSIAKGVALDREIKRKVGDVQQRLADYEMKLLQKRAEGK